jgi:CheY-like chemotaxis protein
MSTPQLSNRLVLVVDDEPMLRNLLCRLLRMEGYDVIEAEEGGGAHARGGGR